MGSLPLPPIIWYFITIFIYPPNEPQLGPFLPFPSSKPSLEGLIISLSQTAAAHRSFSNSGLSSQTRGFQAG